MKKQLFLFGLCSGMFFKINYSQNVGISPTGAAPPDNSAGLDVDFTNKGLLIPRVALTSASDAVTISSPATSLLVYNTGAGGLSPSGYYYNAGTPGVPNWVRLLITGTPSDAWLTLGNAGTTPGTHFMGTTDNVALVFKTNNIERMRVMGNGQVVVNNTTPFAGDVFSSYAAGTNAAINGYATGSGEAVYGQNTGTGYTMVGITTNNNPAVYGQGPATGVYGVASTNNGTGLFGVGPASVTVDGVTGIAGHNNAMGVVAFNSNATGTGLLAGGNNVGMNYLTSGSAIAATATQYGIVSYGTNASNGNGILASGNNLGVIGYASGSGGTFQGQTVAVYGHAVGSGSGTFGGYFDNGGGNYAYVGGFFGGTGYKINGLGSVSTIVRNTKGEIVNLYCPEAPEILFEDYGIGKLVNGKAHIDLDPTFAKNITVNDKHPLRVFIQLEGDCKGVYVTNKTQSGFDVVELNNGKSNIAFSWHVVANKADEYDENGNLLSKNADIRFGPAPPRQIPTVVESKTKSIKVPKIPSIQPKNVSQGK